MNKAIKPQSLLNVHEQQNHVGMRTDLIRQKAAMRAAGVEPGDPTILQMRNNVPTIATTVSRASAGPADLGRADFQRFATVTGTSLGAAQAFSAIQPLAPADAANHARSGAFSKTFRIAPR